ncbi:MAG: hypothetical protein A2287_00565 [Candidatus Melainabacteria bacterium RIFOXYA12_FULL_32_12]|nr:MAG: hypothetical protein A2287_00565 [Candidatus Melainabacteria bacterium RIFOXYA12_FULL_32_12]
MEKLTPHNLDAEKFVLGCILTDNNSMINIIDKLKPDYFYNTANKKIFEAMVFLHKGDIPIELITLSEYFSYQNKLDDIGGKSYISSLNSEIISTASIGYYADIVKKKHTLRQIIKASQSAIQLAQSESDPDSIIEKVQSNFLDILMNTGNTDVISLLDCLNEISNTVDSQYEEYKQTGQIVKTDIYKTGYEQLDRALVGGFRKQDLIVLGARSRIGKSAFILNLIANMAIGNDIPMLIVSLEMKREALGKRLFSIESNITKSKFEYANLWTETDFRVKSHTLKKISENYAPVFITDKPKQTLLEIESTAQKLFIEHKKPGIIFIDHLSLIHCSEKIEGGERAVIDYITRELKIMARRLNSPIVVLSQLNRETDKTTDKKPTLSNLRMSAMIEANADIVLLLHRDDCYRKAGDQKTNKAELSIAKGREGGTGYITFDFIDYLTKFIEKEGEF